MGWDRKIRPTDNPVKSYLHELQRAVTKLNCQFLPSQSLHAHEQNHCPIVSYTLDSNPQRLI